MKWFGQPWGAHINRTCEQTVTPTGKSCLYCNLPIQAEDSGVTMPYVKSETEWDPEGAVYHHWCLIKTLGIDYLVEAKGPEFLLQSWEQIDDTFDGRFYRCKVLTPGGTKTEIISKRTYDIYAFDPDRKLSEREVLELVLRVAYSS